jgi:antitoxin (DNA-binding transcriptional repressor) of toxin-antitoxin stability system
MEAAMAAKELTVTVTGFKAHCLDLIRKLEHGDLKRITLTRRGKPVAEISPQRAAPKKTFADIYGCMRGKMKIPEGADLTEPTVHPEDWDAVRGVLLNE